MASEELDAVVNEVAHSLQVALLLATRLRQTVGEQAGDSVQLEAAVGRAATALKRLSPEGVMPVDDRNDVRVMRETAQASGLTDLLVTAARSKQGSQVKESLKQALLLLGVSDGAAKR